LTRCLSIPALATALVLAGCAANPPANPAPVAPPASTGPAAGSNTQTQAAQTTSSTPPGSPAHPSEQQGVSAKARAYAKSIGGWSHKGEPLYVVIGKSMRTEQEAQTALDKALPLFGDMQTYYIVQRSDNFSGLSPGWWIVAEAYRAKPSPDNLALGRRAFPDAYVKRVVVRVTDPVPVYEDLVGGD
jgi:hypothetical protein